jgi:hypothetical protein
LKEPLSRALFRGEAIARTETGQAVLEASNEAFEQALEKTGYGKDAVTKVWRTAGDGKVRDSHAAMDGQEVVGLDAIFVSPDTGAEFKYPMDDSLGAGAGEIINCRCLAEYNIDFSQGLEPDQTNEPPTDIPPAPEDHPEDAVEALTAADLAGLGLGLALSAAPASASIQDDSSEPAPFVEEGIDNIDRGSGNPFDEPAPTDEETNVGNDNTDQGDETDQIVQKLDDGASMLGLTADEAETLEANLDNLTALQTMRVVSKAREVLADNPDLADVPYYIASLIQAVLNNA